MTFELTYVPFIDSCDQSLWYTPLGIAIEAFIEDGEFGNGDVVHLRRANPSHSNIFAELDKVAERVPDTVLLYVSW